MILTLIEIRMADDTLGGFCEFRIGAEAPLPTTCLLVIERPGQDKAFLAADGWQSNYARLATPVRHDPPAAGYLQLSGTLLRFLETGYNYRITLFDPDGSELGLFVVNWYPQSGLVSPVVPPHRPLAIVPDATTDEPPEIGTAIAAPRPDSRASNPPLRQVIRCGNCGVENFTTFPKCWYCKLDLQ